MPTQPATAECLTERQVHDLLAGTLGDAQATASRTHIDSCDSCRELVAAAASTQTASKPESIGRYAIDRVAGAGAMGIVYEALDPQLGRRVAIKLLRHERGGDADRLLREARAVAQISHPNVIAVYDSGVADGEVFMVMELIRGITLREWLAERKRTWFEIVDVAIRAGRGLAAVHAAGLVHRDIKPDNILVASDGRILLTDFGLVFVDSSQSATLGGNVDLTQTGAVVGTPAYLAPEVIDGQPATASADQFSYCVSLWEALAGERPFLGATLPALREAIDSGPGVLTVRGMPRMIAGAIARGLAVSPAARWPALDALLAELDTGLRSHRRQRWILAGAAALAVASIAGAVASRAFSSSDAPACDEGAQELAAVWGPDVRDRIGAAFARTRVPYAASTWSALATVIDDYGKRWATSYNAACTATHIKQIQSATTLDLRTRCLGQRRAELAAMLDVFAAPDAAQIDSAPRSFAALVAPAVCDDVATLAEVVPIPDALDVRAHVAAAQQTLATGAALFRAGRYQRALDLATGVIAIAERIGYPPLTAKAHLDRASYATALERWDLAKPSLDAALLAAERGRDHRVRSDVHLRLAVVALHHDDQKTALVELDRGDAILGGISAAARQRAIFADVRGTALGDMGKLPEAVEALERAARLYAEASGPTSIDVAGPLKKLGYIAAQRGDIAGAIDKLQRVLAIQRAAQGPDHPEIGVTQTDLAFMLRDLKRYPEAIEMANAARANLARSMPDSPEYWEATRSLVGIYRRQGDRAAAEQLAREVLGVFERKDPADQRTADAIDDLAQTLTYDPQRSQEVLALRKRALAIRLATHDDPKHTSIVMAKLALADATAGVGKCAGALELYDQLQPLGDEADRPPYLAPAIRLGRARCLWETGHHAAAKAAAADARAKAAGLQREDLVAEIDAWLAAHP